VVAVLRGEIERWREGAARIALPKAQPAGELEAPESEALRALGYAE
jgi:hypothetical protein